MLLIAKEVSWVITAALTLAVASTKGQRFNMWFWGIALMFNAFTLVVAIIESVRR